MPAMRKWQQHWLAGVLLMLFMAVAWTNTRPGPAAAAVPAASPVYVKYYVVTAAYQGLPENLGEVATRFLNDLGPADLPQGSNLDEVLRVSRCVLRPDLYDDLDCSSIGRHGHGGDPLRGDKDDKPPTDDDALVTEVERGPGQLGGGILYGGTVNQPCERAGQQTSRYERSPHLVGAACSNSCPRGSRRGQIRHKGSFNRYRGRR